MITHEEARIIKKDIQEGLKKGYWSKTLISELYDYITQQEKKDKLLELYRKVRKQVEEYNDTPNKTPKVLHLALDIQETLDKIDKLEEELK